MLVQKSKRVIDYPAESRPDGAELTGGRKETLWVAGSVLQRTTIPMRGLRPPARLISKLLRRGLCLGGLGRKRNGVNRGVLGERRFVAMRSMPCVGPDFDLAVALIETLSLGQPSALDDPGKMQPLETTAKRCPSVRRHENKLKEANSRRHSDPHGMR